MIALSTNQKTNKAYRDFEKPGSECGTKCDFVSADAVPNLILLAFFPSFIMYPVRMVPSKSVVHYVDKTPPSVPHERCVS